MLRRILAWIRGRLLAYRIRRAIRERLRAGLRDDDETDAETATAYRDAHAIAAAVADRCLTMAEESNDQELIRAWTRNRDNHCLMAVWYDRQARGL